MLGRTKENKYFTTPVIHSLIVSFAVFDFGSWQITFDLTTGKNGLAMKNNNKTPCQRYSKDTRLKVAEGPFKEMTKKTKPEDQQVIRYW